MIEVAELKAKLPGANQVLSDLYAIQFTRNQARCPFGERHNHGDRNPSLRYSPKSDRIFCSSQQCFGEKGSDAIGAVQTLDGCGFPEAVAKLARQYGVPNGAATTVPAAPSKSTTDNGNRLVPTEVPRAQRERDGFRPVAEYSYGENLRKVRLEHQSRLQEDSGKPEKTFLWEHFKDGNWWSGKGGLPTSIYFNRVARERDQAGLRLGVEGEAAADAAGSLNTAAFSFREPIPPADARELVDSDVVLWPDNDAPGQKYVHAAAKVILEHGDVRSLKILTPLRDWPSGFDMADAVQNPQWTRGRIDELIAGAEPYVPSKEATAGGRQGPHRALPSIDAGNQDLPVVTAAAWEALAAANDPPRLFRYGGLPTRLERDDDERPLLRNVTEDRLRHELARAADWYRVREGKDGFERKPAYPPIAVVRDVLARADLQFPVLNTIVEAPIFAADGSLHTTLGYQRASLAYYAPKPGFTVPDVPERPTDADIRRAKNVIEDLIGDFPFIREAERAHAVGLLLLPFARLLINGPTPLHLIEKPVPGTGATLLADALLYPTTGHPISAMTEGRDEDEWRKRITARLRSGSTAIVVDNLRRRLDSAALASAITTEVWEDRLLGKSEDVRIPVRAAWLATGNNPSLSSEMARRTVRIRLDPRCDQPWLREDFRHPDLRVWMAARRHEIVWGALVLVQSWLAAGKPQPDQLPNLGMFESWSRVIGAILRHVDIDGFLSNLEDFYNASDTEGEMIRSFLAAWWEQHEDRAVGVSELFTLCNEETLDLGDGNERSQKTRLGKKLTELRDRHYGLNLGDGESKTTVCITYAGKSSRAKRWRLVRIGGEEQ